MKTRINTERSGREGERNEWRERKKETVYLLVHSPCGHSRDWDRLTLGARAQSRSQEFDGRVPGLEPSSCFFPRFINWEL